MRNRALAVVQLSAPIFHPCSELLREFHNGATVMPQEELTVLSQVLESAADESGVVILTVAELNAMIELVSGEE